MEEISSSIESGCSLLIYIMNTIKIWETSTQNLHMISWTSVIIGELLYGTSREESLDCHRIREWQRHFLKDEKWTPLVLYIHSFLQEYFQQVYPGQEKQLHLSDNFCEYWSEETQNLVCPYPINSIPPSSTVHVQRSPTLSPHCKKQCICSNCEQREHNMRKNEYKVLV